MRYGLSDDKNRATDKPIVFFDGQCVFCNKCASFLCRMDKKKRLYYAALQGETAKKVLKNQQIANVENVIFYHNHKEHIASTGFLRALIALGGLWRFFGLFLLVPECMRDAAYLFISRRRYLWLGQGASCPLPGKGQRDNWLP